MFCPGAALLSAALNCDAVETFTVVPPPVVGVARGREVAVAVGRAGVAVAVARPLVAVGRAVVAVARAVEVAEGVGRAVAVGPGVPDCRDQSAGTFGGSHPTCEVWLCTHL